MASQTALNTSATSTSGVPAATHAATALATTDDVLIPPILNDEQMLGYQEQIDQCVRMLKTKKEGIARYEKQVATLLERVPRAVSSRDRRMLQKPVDEYNALILHERQLMQTAKEKLAFLMREMQVKREHAPAQNTSSAPRKKRGTNTNIVAPVRFCKTNNPSLLSQRGRLLRMFQSTAFHRFGLLRRAQFDYQEKIVAEETTQNTFENPAVYQQAIILEIPQASQVVDSFPSLEKFVAPMCNQVLQEQIVAGESTQNIVENPAVQEQVIVQENSEIQVMERIQEHIVDSVNSCKLPRESWLLSCGSCKRSANMLMLNSLTRRSDEQRRAGTKNELLTIYELATACRGG